MCAGCGYYRTGWSSSRRKRSRPRPSRPAPHARIAVDAMGADAAPRVEVEGVLAAVRATRRARSSLVGDEPRLRAGLAALGATDKDRIVVRHAPDVITMHDAPSMAVKQKKQSSMRVCFDLVKAGEVDAVVSAGNSGAMMACGLFVLGRLPGVERPGDRDHVSRPRRASARCCDMGANIDPKPSVLAQFAVLGSVYARLLHGKTRPAGRPAVERLRGVTRARALTRDAHQLLRARRRPAGGARTSTTSATSRGATSSAARSTWSSPTASPATSCSRASRALAEVVFDMVREEVARSACCAKLGAAADDARARALAAPHRLRRDRRRAAAGRRRRRADLPRRLERDGDQERGLRRRDRFAQMGLRKELTAGGGRHNAFCGTGRRRRRASRRAIS